MTPEEIEALAYIQACELVGPNAPEFDALLERITEELSEDLSEDLEMKAPLFLAVTCEGLPTEKMYATLDEAEDALQRSGGFIIKLAYTGAAGEPMIAYRVRVVSA